MRKVTAYLLAGSIVVGGAVSATRAIAYSQQPVAKAKMAREKHPAIHAAINSLEKAKAELQAANHDFGGHRVDAIKSIDEALKQLRLADAYDAK